MNELKKTTFKFEDMNNVCRFCLKCDLLLNPIFNDEIKSEDENCLPNLDIAELVSIVTNLKIEIDDEFPKFMCTSCSNFLHDFMNFRQECVKSYDIMTRVLALDVSENIEDDYNDDDDDENCEQYIQTETEDDDDYEGFIGIPKIEIEHLETTDEGVLIFMEDESPATLPIEYTIENEEYEDIEEIEDYVSEQEISSKPKPRHYKKRCTKEGDAEGKSNEKKSRYKKKAIICTVCGQPQLHITQHMRIHSDARPHTCPICGKSFRQSSHLHRHVQGSHATSRPFDCDICGMTFTNSRSLKNHKERHTGIKKHVCSVCDHRFYTAYALNRHMLVHTQDRQHKCEECGWSFTQKSDLVQHLRIHTGEKPYDCMYCDLKFRTSGMRRSHIKRNHADQINATDEVG